MAVLSLQQESRLEEGPSRLAHKDWVSLAVRALAAPAEDPRTRVPVTESGGPYLPETRDPMTLASSGLHPCAMPHPPDTCACI